MTLALGQGRSLVEMQHEIKVLIGQIESQFLTAQSEAMLWFRSRFDPKAAGTTTTSPAWYTVACLTVTCFYAPLVLTIPHLRLVDTSV